MIHAICQAWPLRVFIIAIVLRILRDYPYLLHSTNAILSLSFSRNERKMRRCTNLTRCPIAGLPSRSAALIKDIAMTKLKTLFAVLIVGASFNVVAADWNMVSSSAEEQVFIDSQSIVKDTDNLLQVNVLENFADTTNMGHGLYDHKSRFILLAVDCKAGAVTYQQWSLHADALGSGATVWADSMQGGPAFFRPEPGTGYERVVATVCNSPIAMH